MSKATDMIEEKVKRFWKNHSRDYDGYKVITYKRYLTTTLELGRVGGKDERNLLQVDG